MMDEIIDPRDPRKRAPSVGSSPVGCSPRFADTALRICFGNAVGFSKGKKFDSLHGHRIDPLLLGCLWTFEKCFRLITGRQDQGGLMTPNTLRVVSFFFLALPVAGLFTGYYRKMGLVAIFQAVMYFLGFLGLHALARKREGHGGSDGQTKA